MTSCPCARPRAVTCASCGEPRCVWHFALSAHADAADLQPVCYPPCNAPLWESFRTLNPTQRGGEA